MERATKKLTTPGGNDLELKSFINARERNQLRSVMLDNMKFDVQNPSASEVKGSTLEMSEAKLIEVAVISYAGSNEKILERLLEGTPEEYDFVVAEAQKVNSGFTTAK